LPPAKPLSWLTFRRERREFFDASAGNVGAMQGIAAGNLDAMSKQQL
jgi:hypothetical protein